MESVTLRVAEALTRDVGRGLVRLDPTDMGTLGVQTGETVQFIGKRSTVAKALPAYAEDRGQGQVQMDGILRENAQAGLGDRVQMQKIVCPVARSVVLQPLGEAVASAPTMRHMTSVLEGLRRVESATRCARPSWAASTASSPWSRPTRAAPS